MAALRSPAGEAYLAGLAPWSCFLVERGDAKQKAQAAAAAFALSLLGDAMKAALAYAVPHLLALLRQGKS